MTEPFDPYRKWLGIPVQDQPPNHYRLLGIERFEADPDVIANAADGRMAQIKNFQAGKYSAHSQRLLNELATAKVCLLNPAKKADYDRQLRELDREQVERFEGPPPPRASDIPTPPPPRVTDLFAPSSPVVVPDIPSFRTQDYRSSLRRKQSPWTLPLIFLAAAAAFIALLAIWLKTPLGDSLRENHPHPPAPAARPMKPPVPKPVVQPAPAKKPVPKKPAPEFIPPKFISPKIKPKKPETVESPKRDLPAKERPVEPAIDAPRTPAGLEDLFGPDATPDSEEPADSTKSSQEFQGLKGLKESKAPKEPVEKLAAPDTGQQYAAELQIREVYGRELNDVKTADERMALAEKLVRQSREADDAPAARFVLLRLARDLAAQSGDAAGSIEIVREIEEQFIIDGLNMKADMLVKAWDSHRTSGRAAADEVGNSLGAAWRLADEAVAADDFEAALRAARLGVVMTRTAKDAMLGQDAAARVRELERLRGKFAAVKRAIDDLAQEPDNAEAHQAVGSWRCFTAGDWPRGLPHLARGNDALLAELARRDLAAPKDARGRLLLADDWWTMAEKNQEPVKSRGKERAVYWYKLILSELSGMDRIRAQKRFDEMEGHQNDPFGNL